MWHIFTKKGTTEIPLRFTPRCFSNASSISLEPRIIQGVVPQTKRWYLPTWKEIKNFICLSKAARRQMVYVYHKLTHGLTNHLWSVEHGVEGCNLIYTNGSNFNNLSHLRHPKKYNNMIILGKFGTNHLKRDFFLNLDKKWTLVGSKTYIFDSKYTDDEFQEARHPSIILLKINK